MVKEKRITENPLAHVSLLNEKADRRIERHPYSVEELGLLLAATESGETHHGLTGYERSLVYRLAVETGLRWKELRSLSRASFDFEAEPATVTVAAGNAKNQKKDTLPLRPALAADLKQYMALFLPRAKAFAKMETDCGAEMLKTDLEAAGVLSRNADGNLVTVDELGLAYDFHGLRHTFATLGAKAGIPLVAMQKLMRHSDPKLTAGIYTHILVTDKADELAKLPEIAATAMTEAEAMARTGTTDAEAVGTPFFRDRKRDSFSTNFNGQTRTYRDDGTEGNGSAGKGVETKNPPVGQGENNWWGEMDSNHRRAGPDRFTVCRQETATHDDDNSCVKQKNIRTGRGTVSLSACHNDLVPSLPPDLAEVSVAWPCLPTEIKAAILTLARSAQGITLTNSEGNDALALPKSDAKGVRVNRTPLSKKGVSHSDTPSDKGAPIQGPLGHDHREGRK